MRNDRYPCVNAATPRILPKPKRLPTPGLFSGSRYTSRMLEDLKAKLAKDGTVSFATRVRPYAPVTSVTGKLLDGSLKINIDAPSEEGKANAELIRFLAEEFNVVPPRVRILAGSTGRRKLIKIETP